MGEWIKKNWFLIFIFIIFTILSYFFVYSGDDWFWASKDAVEYLKNGFRHYNGRFVSNIISMIMARSIIIKCIAYGFITTLVLYIIRNLINKENNSLMYMFIILFLLVDKDIFTQGFVWASGFVSYFITVALIFYLLKLICEDKFQNMKFVISIILGFISSLFLENMAILLLLINLGLIIYSKLKKIKKHNYAFFIGNIIGTALSMFNTLAYSSDADNRELYLSDMFDIFTGDIVPYYFGKSLVIVVALVISLLIFVSINRRKISKTNYITFVIISISYLVLNLIGNMNEILNASVLVLFTLISFITLIKTAEGDMKKRFIWYFILKVGYIAPLVIVHSIGPRLLLFPNIIDIMMILEIYNLYVKHKIFNIVLPIFVVIMLSAQFIKFYNSSQIAHMSKDIIISSLEKGDAFIEIPKAYAINSYHYYVPISEYLEKYFIEFYEIDTNIINYHITFE